MMLMFLKALSKLSIKVFWYFRMMTGTDYVGDTNRRKIILHDLRQCNIDKLRYYLGTYDWEPVVLCKSCAIIY